MVCERILTSLTLNKLIFTVISSLYIAESSKVCNGVPGLCDLTINNVCYPGTHNSGAGFDGVLRYGSGVAALSCLYRNQGLNYTSQLDFGIRYLDIDPCYHGKPGSSKPKLTGTWTCHASAYGGAVAKILKQIDVFMNRPENRNEFIMMHFNHDAPEGEETKIFNDLTTRLKTYWSPNNARKLAMNDEYGKTQRWPTLRSAVDKNARIFVMIAQRILNTGNREPWMNTGNLIGSTWRSHTISIFHSCSAVVKASVERCPKYTYKPLQAVDVYGSQGMCISTMQSRCNSKIEEAANSCLQARRPVRKTVNAILVDYPEEDGQKRVLEACKKINLENVDNA